MIVKRIRHDFVAKHELQNQLGTQPISHVSGVLVALGHSRCATPSPLLHPARHPEYCDAERGSGAFKIPMRIVGADQAGVVGLRAWQLPLFCLGMLYTPEKLELS